jgi:predicted dehydrogenase
LASVADEVPEWWAEADQGGGWLGAHGSQLIDQLRVTLGEFESVSASLPRVADRGMSADDAFVVHFRMRSCAVGTLQSTSGDLGPPIIVTRVVGSGGTAWIEGVGSTVKVADRTGTRTITVSDDIPVATRPPLPDGLVSTTYERMISHGLDFGPYARLAEVFRCRIEERPPPPGPAAATFVDGVRQMAVLDAVRASAASRTWMDVEEPIT